MLICAQSFSWEEDFYEYPRICLPHFFDQIYAWYDGDVLVYTWYLPVSDSLPPPVNPGANAPGFLSHLRRLCAGKNAAMLRLSIFSRLSILWILFLFSVCNMAYSCLSDCTVDATRSMILADVRFIPYNIHLFLKTYLPASHIRLDDAVPSVKPHLPQLFQYPLR